MSKPPLWEVMTRARYKSAGLGEHVTLAVAAEIRAVAEWIDSGETEVKRPPSTACLYALLQWARRDERRSIRDELLLEADRAEKGEAEQ